MLKHYVKVALRQLWRARGATLLNLFCLGLGLCVFFAAYTVIAFMHDYDRHFARSDRIYALTQSLEAPAAGFSLIRVGGKGVVA